VPCDKLPPAARAGAACINRQLAPARPPRHAEATVAWRGPRGRVSAKHCSETEATMTRARALARSSGVLAKLSPSLPMHAGFSATLKAALRRTHSRCCSFHDVGSSGRLPRRSSCISPHSPVENKNGNQLYFGTLYC
jgi:hypothetical protein